MWVCGVVAWVFAFLDLLAPPRKTFPLISICVEGRESFQRWVRRDLELFIPVALAKTG